MELSHCKRLVETPFCAECGEEPIPARDLTLRGLAAKVLHALTSIDAPAVRTARCLFVSPGELTARSSPDLTDHRRSSSANNRYDQRSRPPSPSSASSTVSPDTRPWRA